MYTKENGKFVSVVADLEAVVYRCNLIIKSELFNQLRELDIPLMEAEKISEFVSENLKVLSPRQCWQATVKMFLTSSHTDQPFSVHWLLYKSIYPDWDKIPAPAWCPENGVIKQSNIVKLMNEMGFNNYQDFHQWSTSEYKHFWATMVKKLNIVFHKPFNKVADLHAGVESIEWFKGSDLNIVESCFDRDLRQDCSDDIAIVAQTEQGSIHRISYHALNTLSNQIARSLENYIMKGTRVAMVMPMTSVAVAIYLGILKVGGTVVSIAESFAAEEIDHRCKIADVKMIFTQQVLRREGKILPLYEKMLKTNVPCCVVLQGDESENLFNARQVGDPRLKDLTGQIPLREKDLHWNDFLQVDDQYNHKTRIPVACTPSDCINILFSSGTTSEPKAIPWTQTTPIKCASDAYLHHNLRPGDVFCWPSSLGWMMGPWLVFACLINRATIALYEGSPMGFGFGKFVEEAKVTLLGVVPSLVKNWRTSGCMEDCDWRGIKLFTSTGECSSVADMLYLMSLADYRPIIEYCGGTEIGGAYISSTIIEPNAPAAFTTKAIGLDFVMLNEQGLLSDNGEVALIPPSLGLSTSLLNKDHHQVYYADLPQLSDGRILRRHGDQLERYFNGFYRLHGRADDTMNLGGIKISAAEIEQVLNILPWLHESAAVAVEPVEGGPSQLVIFAVLKNDLNNNKNHLQIEQDHWEKDHLKDRMQEVIKERLNPLFKISEVIVVESLIRTASQKVMRRLLRDQYRLKI